MGGLMDKRNKTASIKVASTGDGISLTTLGSLAFMAYLHQSLRQQTKGKHSRKSRPCN